MAFDSIDKIFNDMIKRYAQFFGQDTFGFPPRFSTPDMDEEPEGLEVERESEDRGGKPRNCETSRKFGYEIISGSDMKEPVIRIYGDPDEFPELKARLERFLKQGLDSFLDKQGVPMIGGGELSSLAPEPVQTEENGTKEPFSESFKEKDGSTTVNVDLPGVKEHDVSVRVNGKTLRVEAHGDSRHYEKTIQLEGNATEKDMQWRLNNGILEIKLRNAKP